MTCMAGRTGRAGNIAHMPFVCTLTVDSDNFQGLETFALGGREVVGCSLHERQFGAGGAHWWLPRCTAADRLTPKLAGQAHCASSSSDLPGFKLNSDVWLWRL